MNHDKDKAFDEMLRNKLKDHQPEVSSSLWNRIQEELDQQAATGSPLVPVKELKPRKWARYRWSAAAAILILAGAWILRNQGDPEVIYLKNQPVSGSLAESRLSSIDPNPGYPVDLPGLTAAPSQPQKDNDKLADDLQTISQVLAAALERTERKSDRGEIQNDALPSLETALPMHILAPPAERHIHPNLGTAAIQLTQVQDLPTPKLTEESVSPEADRQGQQSFGVSRLLNLMVAQIDRRSEKIISFTSDDEGSLKIDFNLAQNRK